MPDSPRAFARRICAAPSALLLVILLLAGCGGVSGFSVPSIPDISKTGGASSDIDGNTFQVSQSGSIQADFGHPNPLT